MQPLGLGLVQGLGLDRIRPIPGNLKVSKPAALETKQGTAKNHPTPLKPST